MSQRLMEIKTMSLQQLNNILSRCQAVERAICQVEGWWFNPWLHAKLSLKQIVKPTALPTLPPECECVQMLDGKHTGMETPV